MNWCAVTQIIVTFTLFCWFTALNQMGYRLSPAFSQMVVKKYDTVLHKQIGLDHYIKLCAVLNSLTASFRQRDTQMTGSININYEDFMMVVLSSQPWCDFFSFFSILDFMSFREKAQILSVIYLMYQRKFIRYSKLVFIIRSRFCLFCYEGGGGGIIK